MAEEPASELSSAQVADYLGVKRETVYAYVSRGVLSPVRRETPGGSFFALEDVRALIADHRSHSRGRPPSTSDDVRTRITRIDQDRLSYRGQDVSALVGTSFEEVCGLLWEAEPPTFALPIADRRALAALTRGLPAGVSALDRMKHAVLVAGGADTGRHDRAPDAVREAGRRAAGAMALALPGARPAESLAAVLAGHLGGADVGDLDAALILLADHDLAVSTTALRVAVSARADTYSAFLAALAAADSPVHMGASRAAHRWLTAALADPRAALDEALTGRRPPGFGHVVYRDVDPRAELLFARVLPRASAPVQDAVGLFRTELLERRGWLANVDLALALMAVVDGLSPQAGTVIFACARVAGWTAHALEELGEKPLRFRLRGLYTGLR